MRRTNWQQPMTEQLGPTRAQSNASSGGFRLSFPLAPVQVPGLFDESLEAALCCQPLTLDLKPFRPPALRQRRTVHTDIQRISIKSSTFHSLSAIRLPPTFIFLAFFPATFWIPSPQSRRCYLSCYLVLCRATVMSTQSIPAVQ